MLRAAIAAVPAAASDGYQSLNTLAAGDSGMQGQLQPNDYTSLNAARAPSRASDRRRAQRTAIPVR
jgi:hypothetical protein